MLRLIDGLRCFLVVVFGALVLGSTGIHLHSEPVFSAELKDTAPERMKRKRNAEDARLQISKTPAVGQLKKKLARKGLSLGNPVFIRAFKSESVLEVWMKRDGVFKLFASYPVCNWSGTLGPKIAEGDKQTPEGFYTVTHRRLHRVGRWPRSLNLGFPNLFERSHARSGSYILIHGGCSSVGCFAMTNAVMEEIYQITSAAIRNGQKNVSVHTFPFRMTDTNLAKHKTGKWKDFWQDIKIGYDSFERTRIPPRVSVCQGRYVFEDTAATQQGGEGHSLAVCGAANVATAEATELLRDIAHDATLWPTLSKRRRNLLTSLLEPKLQHALAAGDVTSPILRKVIARARVSQRRQSRQPRLRFTCSPGLASCRRHMALQRRKAARKRATKNRARPRRVRSRIAGGKR